jgi:hypothetical protein
MATVMDEHFARRAVTFEYSQPLSSSKRRLVGERLAPWLIFAAALAIGVSLYASFWPHSRDLWYGIDHDRSAHFEFGVNLAMDLRFGNIAGLFHHLDGARVWGPLHGIVSAPVQLLLGPDHRWGILPSWCAWIATVVLGFLIARRLLWEGGTAAGVLAAMWIALSPAHRAFATDVMLESMGAALTLWCLYRYLIARQDVADATRGRWLGLSLTALFLAKSNYWVLIVVGLAAGECLLSTRMVTDWAMEAGRFALSKPGLLRQVRNPWNYLIVGLLALAAGIAVTGGGIVQLGRMKISLTRGHNILQLAYAIAFVRALLWWRREGIGARFAERSPILRDIACWHLWPVAVYFLLPKRLGYFLWFVSPANGGNHARESGLWGGATYYFQGLIEDYHHLPWTLFAVLTCVMLGLATVGAWRKGSVTLYCFLALACLATCQHPMHKFRHAHTWVALLWILGSAAFIHLVYAGLRSLPKLRVGLAGAACLALALAHASFWLAPGRAQEGGVRPGTLRIMTLADDIMPSVRDANRPLLLSNVYAPFFLSWSFQEAAGHQRFATGIDGLDLEQPDPEFLKAWAAKSKHDVIALIEIAETSPFFFRDQGNLNTAAVREFLEQTDSGFRKMEDRATTEQVRITLWKRL